MSRWPSHCVWMIAKVTLSQAYTTEVVTKRPLWDPWQTWPLRTNDKVVGRTEQVWDSICIDRYL